MNLNKHLHQPLGSYQIYLHNIFNWPSWWCLIFFRFWFSPSKQFLLLKLLIQLKIYFKFSLKIKVFVRSWSLSSEFWKLLCIFFNSLTAYIISSWIILSKSKYIFEKFMSKSSFSKMHCMFWNNFTSIIT